MTSPRKPDFIAAAAVLLVQDIQASIEFYVDQLGFELSWFEDRTKDYAILSRNEVGLHLAQAAEGQQQPSLQNLSTCQPADVNFEIRSADELWQEYSEKEVQGLRNPPENREYGVRDFSILDPDGYQIRFNEVLFSAD